jgi:hypothetical protein
VKEARELYEEHRRLCEENERREERRREGDYGQ